MNALHLFPVPQASQPELINKTAYQYESTLFHNSQSKAHYYEKIRELLKSMEQKVNAIKQFQHTNTVNVSVPQQPLVPQQNLQQLVSNGLPGNSIPLNNNNISIDTYSKNVINNGGINRPSNASIISNNTPSSISSSNLVNDELKYHIQRKVMSSPIPPQIIASIPGLPDGIKCWSQVNDPKVKPFLKPEQMAAIKLAFEKTATYYLKVYEQQTKHILQKQQQQQFHQEQTPSLQSQQNRQAQQVLQNQQGLQAQQIHNIQQAQQAQQTQQVQQQQKINQAQQQLQQNQLSQAQLQAQLVQHQQRMRAQTQNQINEIQNNQFQTKLRLQQQLNSHRSQQPDTNDNASNRFNNDSNNISSINNNSNIKISNSDNLNQKFVTNQRNNQNKNNISQPQAQMPHEPQNQNINHQLSSMHTHSPVNARNLNITTSAQFSNTSDIGRPNKQGKADFVSPITETSSPSQPKQHTIGAAKKIHVGLTQQDFLKLRELKIEADKRPILLKDITSNLSQAEKEKIVAILKPVVLSFSRIDQIILFFYQNTRNEKSSIRFFQLKGMFNQVWDGISRGKFMVTVQLAEKIRSEFGQYFSFVSRLSPKTQPNKLQQDDKSLQNIPKSSDNTLNGSLSKNPQGQDESSFPLQLQQKQAFSNNISSHDATQSQQSSEGLKQNSLPQAFNEKLAANAKQNTSIQNQNFDTQKINAQNSEQSQLNLQGQNQLQQNSQKEQKIKSQGQTNQSVAQDSRKEHVELGQQSPEQSKKAARSLPLSKNTQSQKGKNLKSVSQTQEKKGQQQSTQTEGNNDQTQKLNSNTPEIKNSTLPEVPTYGKTSAITDQIKLPTKKRKASAVSTSSSMGSVTSPEELSLSRSQYVKKGKIDESETAKINEIAFKLQRKKEESKKNPLGHFISCLGEALCIPVKEIEKAMGNGIEKKTDNFMSSLGDTGWDTSIVSALTLKNAFQSIDVVNTTPRSIPQDLVKNFDLNKIDIKVTADDNKIIQNSLDDNLMNVNIWNYNELVSVLCVDEESVKRDYWTLEC